MASSNAGRRARRTRGEGKEHVQDKLEERVKEGDYYGALQMYKTLFSRHAKAIELTQACQLAEKGTISLLQYTQEKAATEMALLLIDLYKEHHYKLIEDTKGNILLLMCMYQRAKHDSKKKKNRTYPTDGSSVCREWIFRS